MKNKKNDRKARTKDMLVVSLLPILAAVTCWSLPISFAESAFLFFGLSSIYLSYRKPELISRSLFFALIFTVLGACVDYAAASDGSWFVPKTVFPFRIAGSVPVEDMIWIFMLNYLIIAYFEVFYDHLKHRVIGRRMPYLYLLILLILSGLVLSTQILGHPYQISYFYLKAGLLLCALPLAAFVFKFPKYISIFLSMAPYFFALSLLYEIVGLHNGYWLFPSSHFIGWVHLGSVRFPFEELLFWMILFSSALIVDFEVFDDNRLKFKPLKRH